MFLFLVAISAFRGVVLLNVAALVEVLNCRSYCSMRLALLPSFRVRLCCFMCLRLPSAGASAGALIEKAFRLVGANAHLLRKNDGLAATNHRLARPSF